MNKKRSTGNKGAKLSRSEVVTIRLDPKLRYLTELAARTQRRTTSSFVEWAIQESLSKTLIRADTDPDDPSPSIAEAAQELWDVDEADRFIKLALSYPELLTHDEQILWKLIREIGHLWRRRHGNLNNEVMWNIDESNLDIQLLRQSWVDLQQVAQGKKAVSDFHLWSEHGYEINYPGQAT